jgi:predicted GTPase
MSYRTNPDRILDSIDRARNRDAESARFQLDRQAQGRELDTQIPDLDATNPERVKRIFQAVERAYTKAAHRTELGRLAARFQSVGDVHHHHARGDVSISIQYLDHERNDEVGMAPFEIRPYELTEAKKETKTSRADVNALKVLRKELRQGVLSAYKKLEPRIRDAVRERADMGHLQVLVTVDLRPAE